MEVSYIPIAKARGFTTHWIRSLNIIKALHKYNKEKDELNPLCVIECKAPQNIAMHFAVTME